MGTVARCGSLVAQGAALPGNLWHVPMNARSTFDDGIDQRGRLQEEVRRRRLARWPLTRESRYGTRGCRSGEASNPGRLEGVSEAVVESLEQALTTVDTSDEEPGHGRLWPDRLWPNRLWPGLRADRLWPNQLARVCGFKGPAEFGQNQVWPIQCEPLCPHFHRPPTCPKPRFLDTDLFCVLCCVRCVEIFLGASKIWVVSQTSSLTRTPSAGPPKISLFFPSPATFSRHWDRLGFTRQPENSKRVLFGALAFQKHHQNSTRRHPEREEKNEFCGGRGKKRAKFWASPTLGAHHPWATSPRSQRWTALLGRSDEGRTQSRFSGGRGPNPCHVSDVRRMLQLPCTEPSWKRTASLLGPFRSVWVFFGEREEGRNSYFCPRRC